MIVRPEQRAIGAPPASWWIDAYFRQAGRPYYIGLLSAAAEFGSQHQAVQEVQVVTDRPMRDLTIGRQRIKFFVKRGTAETPTTTPANAFAPVAVSTPAATSLDLLRYADRIGGISRAVEAINGMAKHLDRDDVVSATSFSNLTNRLWQNASLPRSRAVWSKCGLTLTTNGPGLLA
ncbi:hypothetical protein KAF44_40075 [Cupriavidus necator]|nr:hypothetical protein KAF44_40075 [Cupriavidus necator]